jgi:hypothetical protein
MRAMLMDTPKSNARITPIRMAFPCGEGLHVPALLVLELSSDRDVTEVSVFVILKSYILSSLLAREETSKTLASYWSE